MDLEHWKPLLGKPQTDLTLKAALADAGVKRIPKLAEDDTDVRFPLKGTGLELVMTDEAYLKGLDEELGKRPLILSGVLAKCGKSHGKDLYTGSLSDGMNAAMSRDAVRKVMGRPSSKDDDIPVDIWEKKNLEFVVRYASDGQSISTFAIMLPGAE